MKGTKLATLAIAFGLAFSSITHASESKKAGLVEDPAIFAELVAMLERDAASQLEQHLRAEGVLRPVSVSIRLDLAERSLTINFGPGYLPGKYDSYGERFLNPMASSLRFYAEKSGLEVNDIRFLFEGRTLEEYFPEDLAVPPKTKARPAHSDVLVSSSHGYIALYPGRE